MSGSTQASSQAPADALDAPDALGAVLGAVLAVVSMLHEPADAAYNSAGRCIDDQPVLNSTVGRLSDCAELSGIAVLCWDDQAETARLAADGLAEIVPVGPRVTVADLNAVTAAQRWADGWRGGLLSTCPADRGWHAGAVDALLEATGAGAALAVEASFALIDPTLIDNLISHARQTIESGRDEPVFFTPAPPGLSALLVRRKCVVDLAASGPNQKHPGRLLHYLPDAPRIDPVGVAACRHHPDPAVARSLADFRFDSASNCTRLAALQAEDASSLCAEVVQLEAEAAPREVTIELTTRRHTRPIWCSLPNAPIDLDVDLLAAVLSELADMRDNVRITFAGRGDPLLHPRFPDAIAIARKRGMSIHVETDLVGIANTRLARLASGEVDIISVHLPAMTAAAYATVMGRNAMADAAGRLVQLIGLTHKVNRGIPIIVPTFVKLRHNVSEMEAWYDQWIRICGNAVVRGPEAFANITPVPLEELVAAPLLRTERTTSELRIAADGALTDEHNRDVGRLSAEHCAIHAIPAQHRCLTGERLAA